MNRVRVKICGLRDPRQAAEVAAAGADAIGLVFAESSPRWLTAEQAAEVTASIPPMVSTVGVFVSAPPEAINRIAAKARLDLLQLHGEEDPGIVAKLDRPVIKGFRVKGEAWLTEVRQWLAGVSDPSRVRAVLLDAFKPGVHGGTGERFNWEMVADARAVGALAHLPPIILSGGLDADNVLTGIDLIQPWAVDISSGVEQSPGVKDLRKVRRFIETVADDWLAGED